MLSRNTHTHKKEQKKDHKGINTWGIIDRKFLIQEYTQNKGTIEGIKRNNKRGIRQELSYRTEHKVKGTKEGINKVITGIIIKAMNCLFQLNPQK